MIQNPLLEPQGMLKIAWVCFRGEEVQTTISQCKILLTSLGMQYLIFYYLRMHFELSLMCDTLDLERSSFLTGLEPRSFLSPSFAVCANVTEALNRPAELGSYCGDTVRQTRKFKCKSWQLTHRIAPGNTCSLSRIRDSQWLLLPLYSIVWEALLRACILQSFVQCEENEASVTKGLQ